MTAQTSRATTPAASNDWRNRSACRGVDPDLFFPGSQGVEAKRQTERAKRVCRGCPVWQDCLEWAINTNQYAGVWGGLSEEERRRLSRPVVSSLTLCLDHQERIEEMLAEGATHREIGTELGVGHYSITRAVKYFQQERAAADAGVAGVSAA